MKNNNNEYEIFKLKVIPKINIKQAKSLIGKHIHFTCHDRTSNTIFNIPGKVIEQFDNKIKIYTNDILMIEDKDTINNMIYDIDLKDITNVFIFDNYNNNFQDLLNNINEETLLKDTYTLTNIYNNKIDVKITCFDILTIDFIYQKSNKTIYKNYPIYLLNNIKRK